MAKVYPQIKPVYALQTIMSVLKLFELTVGRDGKNRTPLWPFGTYTSRNTPGNSKFVFGPDCCFRSLIKPPKGWGVAYLDYKSQEFFPDERDLCKICVLATLYGQGPYGLAIQLNISPIVAKDLQRTFWRRYPTCAAWREGYVWTATARGYVETVFGWRARVSPGFNSRSIQNFPCQANSAEMLRLACDLGTEAGVLIAAPVHDAVLITAPLADLNGSIEENGGGHGRSVEGRPRRLSGHR
jgi:DNA polymerase-1